MTQLINESTILLILNVIIRSMFKSSNEKNANKLKTLPNEVNKNKEEFLFMSISDGDYHHKINLASPTFATNDLISTPDDRHNPNHNNAHKENRINNVKMNSNDYLKIQYEKLADRYREIEQAYRNAEHDRNVVGEKLEACKKALEGKANKVAKVLMMQNSSKEFSNTDLYLQFQILKEDYKNKIAENDHLVKENQSLEQKIKELEIIITNYTNKSEKKKKQSESNEKVQQKYNSQIEQMKRTNEIRMKCLEDDKKEKEKENKKLREDYERLKFLKDEIEKKRQEDLRFREEVELKLSQKQQQIQEMQESFEESQSLISRLTTEKRELEGKIENCEKNIEEQIEQERLEAHKLQLDLRQLQSEQKSLKSKLDSQTSQNEALHSQIIKLKSVENSQRGEIEELREQKEEHEKNERKLSVKICELEKQMSQTEGQCEKMKKQFDEWMREHEIGKQEEIRMMESRLKESRRGFEEEIEELKKEKEVLQAQIESERERSSRISIELENSYRKMEQVGDKRDTLKREDAYKRDPNETLLRQKSLPTKTISQLKMIESILSRILGIEDFESNKMRAQSLCKDQYVEFIICEMAKQSEEIADIFDGFLSEIECLRQQVRNKEEVISKLLRFSPEEKKNEILEYLNVMENTENFTTEQIYKASRDIEEEANEWKRQLHGMASSLQKSEEELHSLRKLCKQREPLRQFAYQEKSLEKWDLPRRKYGQF